MPRPVATLDRVIIHPIAQSSKIGMLDVPDAYKKKINTGIVVSIGPLVSKDSGLYIGAHVGFGVRVGKQITVENGQFYSICEDDLACIYEPNDVTLIDTNTVKRMIRERITELKATQRSIEVRVGNEWFITIDSIEQSLLDRIDSYVIAEAFEL